MIFKILRLFWRNANEQDTACDQLSDMRLLAAMTPGRFLLACAKSRHVPLAQKLVRNKFETWLAKDIYDGKPVV